MMPSETIASPAVATERAWHYVQDGKSVGPIAESEILRMLAAGRLGANILVWTESMTEWTPAGRIEVFHNQLAALPQMVAPPTTTLRQRAESARVQGISQVRPWVRWLARWFDLFVVWSLADLALVFSGVAPIVPHYVMGLGGPFLWVFVEALLLSTCGTTPGKWVYSTWIADAAGNRPSFSNGLSRAFSVWFMGLGFGLPIVILITQIVSYVKLKNLGITSWDREGHFAVIHERLSPARIIVGLVLLTGLFGFDVLCQFALLVQQAQQARAG
jgi:hypothetical protein